jgi:uncharacterized RDD family membrane protein YckC
VYSEIWWVLFSRPLCCLLLRHLKVITNWLSCIPDFWYPGPSYLVQEAIVPLFLFLFSVLYTKNALNSAQFSQYNTYFSTIWQQFLRTVITQVLVCLIYELDVFILLDKSVLFFFFPGLFFSLSSLFS